MRRFLAYVTMMLTMLCAIVFNTQAVLENKVDAMEYGTGTQLVYSISKRDAADYDTEKYPDYKDGIKNLDEIDIESAVMKRLDVAGVRNADVNIVKGDSSTQEGYQLRITLSPLSDTELANVKEILSYTGSLAIGTEGDSVVYYQSNDEFFDDDDDVATLVYNGTTPYPVIKVKDSEIFDKLKKAAEEAKDNKTSEANRYYADDDSDDSSSEDSTTNAYLWINKQLDDTYDKAFGTHDTVVMQETKSKVLATIDLSNWDSDNLQLSLTTDTDGNSFTISTARAFVNMLNCSDYGFNIDFLYQNTVSATFGSSAISYTYLIFGVVLLAICVLMIVFYGLAGVTSSLTMLGSVLLSFFLFSVLGFEFSVAALGGLAVIVGLSVMISVNYFERVKTEMKNGRGLVKANQEGYHKSFLTSVDISAISLICSVFCFLIGVGAYKTFFGVIMVGTIFTFLITNYLNKWMMFWLVKDNEEQNWPFFGFRKIHIVDTDKTNAKFASADKKHFTKKILVALPAAAALLLAVGLPVGYVLSGSNRSFFNNYSDFSSTYTLNITFRDNSQSYDKLSTSDSFTSYIVAIGESNFAGSYKAISSANTDEVKAKGNDQDAFVYYPKSASVNVVEKTDDENNKYFMIYYTIQVNKNLNQVMDSKNTDVIHVITNTMTDTEVSIDDNTLIAPFTGDSHGVKDSLKVESYEVKPTNVTHTTNYLLLLGFLISCFAFVYLLLRFGINVSLASLGSGTLATGLFIGLLAILRIPFSSYTVFGVLISVFALNLFFVPVLGKNKEILKERGLKKTADDQTRADIANVSAVGSLKMVLPVAAILLIYSLGLAFVNTSLIGLSISSILFLVLDLVLLYFFAVPFYHYLATHISFARITAWNQTRLEKKVAKKNEKVEAVKKVAGPDGIIYVDDGAHETIIPGLNDFKNFD
jgi:protein-export membrane protein SecD